MLFGMPTSIRALKSGCQVSEFGMSKTAWKPAEQLLAAQVKACELLSCLSLGLGRRKPFSHLCIKTAHHKGPPPQKTGRIGNFFSSTRAVFLPIQSSRRHVSVVGRVRGKSRRGCLENLAIYTCTVESKPNQYTGVGGSQITSTYEPV